MKIKFPALLFSPLLFTTVIICAQEPPCTINTFQKTYGKRFINDWARDIVETPDQGFITGGWGGDVDNDFTLMKIDSKGAVVWSKRLIGNGTPKGYMISFTRLRDGNYVAAGMAYQGDYQNTWIVKFDENGNIIWNKRITYPTGLSVIPSKICETADGGLVIVGQYQPYPNAGGAVIVKLDAGGNLLWSKGCLGTLFTRGIITPGIIESKGILFIVGFESGNQSGIIIKMKSSDGTIVEGNSIKVNNQFTYFHSIEEKNNKFYINGYNRYMANDELKNFVLILDANLDVLKIHKFDMGFRRVWETPAMLVTDDDGFIVALGKEFTSDLFLCKVSYNGEIRWKRQYTRPGAQVTFAIKRTSDNGVIGVGASNTDEDFFYLPGNDIFIFRTDSVGLIGDCPVTDPYAVISSPVFTKAPDFFSYDPLSFVVISLNPTGNDITIPVTTVCEKVIVPTCTDLTLTGQDTICHLPDMVVYKAVKNNDCNAPVLWKTDPAFAQIISSTDSTLSIQFKKTGTTKLVSSISNLCETVADSLLIHIFDSPRTINLGPDIPLCGDRVYTLHAGDGFKNYRWQDGSADSIFNVHSPGVYYVSAVNCGGEVFSDTVTISLALPPTGYLESDTTICERQPTIIAPLSDFSKYRWSTGETTKQVTISQPGLYWLEVIDKNGCVGKEYINVKTKTGCVTALYFPSAFTPDNDGKNDQFKGIPFGFLNKYHLAVYNRYGNIVFETSDISKGWDGNLQGRAQDTGSFVWVCEYQLSNQPIQTAKGMVNLIR